MDEEQTTGSWSFHMYHIQFVFKRRNKAGKNSKDGKREHCDLLENAIDTARKHYPKTEKRDANLMETENHIQKILVDLLPLQNDLLLSTEVIIM